MQRNPARTHARRILASALLLTVHAAGAEALPARTQAQIDEVARAVDRYRDFETAKKDGWRLFGGDEPLMGEHYSHPEGPDYLAGQPIDFSRPSNLMYTDIGGKKVLTGVAFVVRLGDDEPLPEGFYGDADRWHVHDFPKAISAALEERPLLNWLAESWLNANYRNKGDNRGRLAMAHTWVTLPNPDGMFADLNRTLPYLKLGLPVEWANGSNEAAARGLHLATAKGCPDTVDGALWIATAKAAQARAVRKACAASAASVKDALRGGDPKNINAVAERSWNAYQQVWKSTLTAEQRARVDAMVEHGNHGDHGEDLDHSTHGDAHKGHDQHKHH
jgi:hypothetical protein